MKIQAYGSTELSNNRYTYKQTVHAVMVFLSDPMPIWYGSDGMFLHITVPIWIFHLVFTALRRMILVL
jgi:hypothetical protein